MQATAKWSDKERFIGVATSGHAAVVDAGTDKTANSPMELVLIGLCGCTAYDVVNILSKKREPFTSVQVHAEAERSPSPPSIFTNIRLVYTIGGKVTRKAVEDAVRLSEEKYCSVAAMLSKTAEITYEIVYLE